MTMQPATRLLIMTPVILACACIFNAQAESDPGQIAAQQLKNAKVQRAQIERNSAARKTPNARASRGPRGAPSDAIGEYFGALAGPNNASAFFNMTIASDGNLSGEALWSIQNAYATVSGSIDANGDMVMTDTLFGFTISASINRNNGAVQFSGGGNNPSGDSFGMSCSLVPNPVKASEMSGSYAGTYTGGTEAQPNSASGDLAFALLNDFRGSGTVTPSGGSAQNLLALSLVLGTLWMVTDLDQEFIMSREKKNFSGTYQIKATGESGNADTARSGDAPDQPAVDPFTASFTVSDSEGFAPLTITYDASATVDPDGKAISQYNWDFGDGTTTTTNPPGGTSHTFSGAGSYTTKLTVTNSDSKTSAPDFKTIVIGDGNTGDGDLFASKANVAVNFAQHINGAETDAFKIAGKINPAGLPDDLSSVLVSFTVNGVQVGAPSPIGGSRSGSRAGQNFIPLLKADGNFSISLINADLREVLNVANVSGEQEIRAKVDVEISGVNIDTPKITGVVRTAFKTQKDAAAKGSFNFITLGTPTGIFKSLRTTVVEGTSGGHKVVASGPIEAEFSTPIIPEGDITVTVGGDGSGSSGDVLTIPKDALTTIGDGAKAVVSYSKSIQEVAGLVKFQINNAKKKFILVTEELPTTDVPPAGSAETSFDLLVSISVPTASGTVVLQTSIEIKRSAASSRNWKG